MSVALQMLAVDLTLLLTAEQLLQGVQHLQVRLRVNPETAVMAGCSHALHALPACKHKITF